MTDINLKTLTPDTSLPATGFLFGADSQASTNPSVYGVTTAITTILGNAASSDELVFNSDTTFARRSIRNFRFGAADAATALAQTLSVQSVVAGTSNTAGAAFTITGSQGTGSGAGGSIVFQVAPAGSSGTAQNALAPALTIASNKSVNFQGALYDSSNCLTFGAANATVVAAVTNSGSTGSPSSFALANNYALAWGSTSNPLGALDVLLYRDNAGTLALRNGTAAQTFNVYGTYTDASNYMRSFFKVASGQLQIGTEISGTGTAGPLVFELAGDQTIYFKTNNSQRLTINGTAINFLAPITFTADNTYDIGTNTATRPRSVYAGTSITPGRGVTVATLPTPTTGMVARVTDALAPAIGTTVAGGGAAYALVNYNGANWTVIGV